MELSVLLPTPGDSRPTTDLPGVSPSPEASSDRDAFQRMLEAHQDLEPRENPTARPERTEKTTTAETGSGNETRSDPQRDRDEGRTSLDGEERSFADTDSLREKGTNEKTGLRDDHQHATGTEDQETRARPRSGRGHESHSPEFLLFGSSLGNALRFVEERTTDRKNSRTAGEPTLPDPKARLQHQHVADHLMDVQQPQDTNKSRRTATEQGSTFQIPARKHEATGEVRPTAEILTALETRAEIKRDERRGEPSVEVDARRWKVHAEPGSDNPRQETRSDERGQSQNQHQHLTEDLRRRQAVKLESTGEEQPAAALGPLNKRHTVTELMAEMRPTHRTATDTEASRQLFSDLVDRARVNLGPDGRSTASIQLKPEHLGRMTLNLELQEGRLQAKLLVDNPEAERLLRQDVDTLRRELKAQGIQLETFAVRLREPTATFEAKTGQDGTGNFFTGMGFEGEARRGSDREDGQRPGASHRGAASFEDSASAYAELSVTSTLEQGTLNVSA